MTDIELFIPSSRCMERSVQVVNDMIKFYYLDNITVLDRIDRVYDTFVRERERIRAYYNTEELVFEQTSRYMYGDGASHTSIASWKLLPRCIAVNKDM